jgi:hypothetical protein
MSAPTAQIQPASQRPRHRLRIVAMAIAASAAGAIPLAAHEAGAHAATRLATATLRIHRLESEGYVAAACMRKGTLMFNPTTGRRVTVNLP